MRSGWLVGACCLLVGACAAPFAASPQEEAQARAMAPGPGRALIYIYRPLGVSRSTDARVYVRPLAPIGQTQPDARSLGLDEQSFWVVDLPAGSVHLTLVAAIDAMGTIDTRSSNTTLVLSAGSKTYLEVQVDPVPLQPARARRAAPKLYVRHASESTDAVGHATLMGVLRFSAAESNDPKP